MIRSVEEIHHEHHEGKAHRKGDGSLVIVLPGCDVGDLLDGGEDQRDLTRFIQG